MHFLEHIKKLLVPYKYPNLKRYGGKIDGGYILSESLLNDSNIIYSYGVGPEDIYISFDKEMAALGKKVYLYDASIEELWDKNVNFIFKSEYVNSANIHSHIVENKHDNEFNMVLKMDIEGNEFETLINADEKIFQHFNQLTVEVHDVLNSHNEENFLINAENTELRWQNKINLLNKLNKFYTLVHIHGNNYSQNQSQGICDVIELTYIRNDFISPNPEILQQGCPNPDLDSPNCPFYAEVEMNWWINNNPQ
jgi:hypothetical protein